MQLSEIFEHGEYLSDAPFETLGQSDSQHPNTLAYCDSIFHLKKADKNPNISCLISTPELVNSATQTPGIVACIAPRERFFQLHELLIRKQLQLPDVAAGIGSNCQIHPTACVSERARIGDNVQIGAYSVINDYVDIGSNTFIDSNVQIGVEGILYTTDTNANIHHVRHNGGVSIGEHCAILSNSVIVRSVHRGLLTNIGNNCLAGIASNIGHEVQIDNNVVVSNHCVVARAAKLEEHSHIGTSSLIREYVRVGIRASVKPGSIVVDNVPDEEAVSGNYAISHKSHLRQYLLAKK